MPKLINKSEKKIITEIMKNPGLNLREIISRTKLSPNVVTEYVNYFVKKEVIIEDRLIKNKRTYLRRFSVNYKSNLAKNLISLIKESEKEEFFLKYKSLEQAFNQIVENVKIKVFEKNGDGESSFNIVEGGYFKGKNIKVTTKEAEIKIGSKETDIVFKKGDYSNLGQYVQIFDSGEL